MARFARTPSALDQLADALRRADATWTGAGIVEWDQLTESQHEQWRAMARNAATRVFEEIIESPGGGRQQAEA